MHYLLSGNGICSLWRQRKPQVGWMMSLFWNRWGKLTGAKVLLIHHSTSECNVIILYFNHPQGREQMRVGGSRQFCAVYWQLESCRCFFPPRSCFKMNTCGRRFWNSAEAQLGDVMRHRRWKNSSSRKHFSASSQLLVHVLHQIADLLISWIQVEIQELPFWLLLHFYIPSPIPPLDITV